jgi:beta/gamma crystallin
VSERGLANSRFHCLMGVASSALTLIGCAQPAWQGQSASATGPDPSGCYVQVYDQAQFMGAREYLNGPAVHRRLTALPFGSNWRNRIRSARVGSRATVTIWANEGLAGTSQRLTSNIEYPNLDGTLTGQVESLEITCERPS